MSDQPSPPPKPKPGSLRDRIAAFEKSASAAPPVHAPPPPRPKPAGFSSWKPKVPSPPSSPSAGSTDAASSAAAAAKAGGMSASDAKESITKAGSLKDRMAALQGKGAFGAPPPLAPKPAVEKPKWKPPPVVHAPVDEGDDAGESSTAAIAAAVERTISPPVSVKSHDSIDNVKSVHEGEEASASASAAVPEGGDNEGEQAPVDPEEEERQRRAAIAARMARLGGARVGMAPPVFGKKPVRKPTQEEVPKPEEPKPVEEPSAGDVKISEVVPSGDEKSSPPVDAAIVASPPPEAPTHDQAEPEVRKSPEILPQRKNSENESILSSEIHEPPPSRAPASMPIPSVPRRTGPPRKKPVKAPSHPPPDLPEEKAEDADATSVEVPKSENIPAEVPEVQGSPTLMEEAVKIIQVKDPELLKDAVVESTPEETPQDVEESKDIDESQLAYHLEASPISSTSLFEETGGVRSPPPSTLPSGIETTNETEEEGEGEDDDEETEDDFVGASPPVPVLPTLHLTPQPDVETPKQEVLQREKVLGAPDREPDAEEEEARKKRVAERMAKMGGINPFAPHPPATGLVSPPPAEGARSPPLASANIIPSPPPIPAASVSDDSQKVPSNPNSPLTNLDQDVHKEGPVESHVEEEEESDEEDERDDVLDNDNSAHEQNENSKEADHDVSRAENHRESMSFTSAPPVPLTTRPPVQVQQYEQDEDDDDDESDYGDEDEGEKEVVGVAAPAPTTKPSIPPRRPLSVSSSPTRHLADVPVPSPPTRHAQPPRRIIPQAPEEEKEEEEEEEEEDEVTDEEADERLATSQLFVPPPSGRGPIAIASRARQLRDEEEEGDGSENDVPALPVPHRVSGEVLPTAGGAPQDDQSDPESDHDGQALPIPPRRTAASVPRVIPPPPPPGRVQEALQHPPHIQRALPDAPAQPQPQAGLDHAPGHLTPALSVGSEEILDEEEGDPIDPSFHSPSRQTSFVNLRSTAQVQAEIAAQAPTSPATQPPLVPYSPSISSPPTKSPPPPPPAPEAEDAAEEDPEQLRRKTIAERMAKLGGIRFGAAPVPTPPVTRPPPRHEEEQEDSNSNATGAATATREEQPAEALSEEEEERARKERIAAKLANMGGMRIGMMPLGMGGLPPQRSHVLREENVDRAPPVPVAAPAPPSRAVPPARPPPPPTAPVEKHQAQSQDADSSDYGASEDGVKVEAEESEVEGGYEHVEEVPPPVPSREGRRQSTGPIASSPPRPPVPMTKPMKRSSTLQSTKSSGGASIKDVGTSPPQRKSFMPQSEYVMVEEPESQELPPPPPPARPGHRAPPSRSTPQVPQPTPTPMVAQTQKMTDSISSHWELPSIPNSSLDFDGATDLSLSWTDAAEPASPTTSTQPQPPPPPPPATASSASASAPPPAAKRPSAMSERQLSADELMALWGRIGVQVCESATSLYEKSKKSLIGDGSYAGFIHDVLAAVPNAAPVPSSSGEYGYVIYLQNGPSVQKRASEIMPGDIVEIHDAKLKGHKGIQTYHQSVGGAGEALLGVVGEFEAKKSKIRVFQANQHVGQQTVESVSYRLEDLKSGTVKVYRVLDA